MNAITLSFRSLPALMARALAIVLVLSAPVLAVPAMGGSDLTHIIEAPTPPKSGLGFVLLVSLQR